VNRVAASNPFSAARVRPGAIEYQFPDGNTCSSILQRLALHGWWGQVVGPHGSGKSTLVASLASHWKNFNRKPLEITLHDRQRRLERGFWQQPDINAATQIIVDGYEQLSWPQRARLKRFCRRRRCGLLVTSHRSVGLPTVYQTRTELQIIEAIVERLTVEHDWHIAPHTLSQLITSHGGNVREVLFELYDLYESQRKHGS
jgi:hypothetical protein